MGCTTSTNSLRAAQMDLPNGNVKDNSGTLPNGSSSPDAEPLTSPPAIDANCATNGAVVGADSPLKSKSSSSSSLSSSSSDSLTHDLQAGEIAVQPSADTGQLLGSILPATVVVGATGKLDQLSTVANSVVIVNEQAEVLVNSAMAEEEVDIDLNDPEVGKAAVKIQAGFKNYMARKKDPPKEEENPKEEEAGKTEEKEVEDGIADIDLNDPEMEKAATKIQATFRGYKTRKETGIEAK